MKGTAMDTKECFTIQVIHQPIHKREVLLHPSTIDRLEVDKKESIFILFGKTEGKVQLIASDSLDENTIGLNEALWKELRIPFPQLRLQVGWMKQSKQLRLGPILAVLTTVYKEGEAIFGNLTDYCKELALYCKKHCIFLYVFSLEDIGSDFINGYVNEHEQWVQKPLPFPDVVHNRIPTRSAENAQKSLLFFQRCRDESIPFFNDHFLNKWEVYEKLSPYEELKPYLPETVLLEDKATLEFLLAKHECLFLKPIHGSQGRKIFRVKKTNEWYELDYSTLNGEQRHQFSSYSSLVQNLKNRIQKRNFIIQQGLELLTYDGRPFDFRILCHRNDKGEWQVTSAVARVSEKEKFISNLARGGEQKKIDEVLARCMDVTKARQLLRFIYELSIETVTLLSREMDGLYGELGVDLALDQNMEPWILEVNSKPSKNMDLPSRPNTIRPSASTIVQYSLYLARFSHL
ncbi:YheC/YheD family protein [Fictibacillus sp. Mic-4]|uniref:YheC/YheD family endospore coat-associated protein n=1 Tax=Fictibacillus sp. Mic-4 TaxID=3132826 RepID=UPI003CFAF674